MSDTPLDGPDDVERLQRAAGDLIDATRRVLDVVERQITDRDRVESVLSSFAEVLRGVAAAVRPAASEPSPGRDHEGFHKIDIE